MTWIELAAMQQDLGACLRRVATGESFMIVQDGRPVAELRPHLTPKPAAPRPQPSAPVLRDGEESPYPDEFGAGD